MSILSSGCYFMSVSLFGNCTFSKMKFFRQVGEGKNDFIFAAFDF